MKKILGFSGVYMIGVLAGVSITSTFLLNQAKLKADRYEEKYKQEKYNNILKLEESLKNVFYSDNTAGGAVTQAKLNEHIYTNIFNTDNIISTTQVGSVAGKKTTLIHQTSSLYSKEKLSNLTSSNILKEDLSNTNGKVFSEDSLRNSQISLSFQNMKKQAQGIFNNLINDKKYVFPCTVATLYKDAWGRNFTYTRVDDSNVNLSFNLPWNITEKKVYSLKLPVLPLAGQAKIKQIKISGIYGSFVVTEDGDLWVTGYNNYGQLGIGNTIDQNLWVKTDLTNVKEVFSGKYNTTYALTTNGDLYGAGYTGLGELGSGNTTTITTWKKVLSGVKDLSLKVNSAMAIMQNGDVWVTGYNEYSKLGFGDTATRTSWTKTVLSDIVKIKRSYNGYSSFAITSAGEIWAGGYNTYGYFGLNNTVAQPWTKLPINDVKDVFIASYHSAYILKNDGTVWASGLNDYGQLGLGDKTQRTTWVKTSLTGIDKMVNGDHYYRSFAVASNGDLWGAGRNDYGELGLGDTLTRDTWTKLLTDVKDVVHPYTSTMAIKNDGTVWVTGYNEYGKLGFGDSNTRTSWEKALPTNVKSVVSNLYGYSSYAITNTGDLWVAGYNGFGHLGLGDAISNKIWTLTSINGTKGVALDGEYRIALVYDNDGNVYAAGYNANGQLGLGHTTAKTSWTKTIGSGALEISGTPSCP